MKEEDDENIIEHMLFGIPGYCKRCGLIKPLAMLAIPGLREDERGELDGGTIHLDPLERSGYCKPCAIKLLESGEMHNERKQ
jgi:hypothetical protein